jgi:hypothetical protein
VYGLLWGVLSAMPVSADIMMTRHTMDKKSHVFYFIFVSFFRPVDPKKGERKLPFHSFLFFSLDLYHDEMLQSQSEQE